MRFSLFYSLLICSDSTSLEKLGVRKISYIFCVCVFKFFINVIHGHCRIFRKFKKFKYLKWPAILASKGITFLLTFGSILYYNLLCKNCNHIKQSKPSTKSRKQPIEWEKILTSDISVKGLISKIYEELIKLNTKKKSD